MSFAPTIRRFISRALGQTTDPDALHALLADADVPLSDAACRACPDPCEQDHDWPRTFDVDHETQMLGTVRPYRRQVVISTGKSDWALEVTFVPGSLAWHLSGARLPVAPSTPAPALPLPPGVFAPSSAGRASVLNGSHHALTHDPAADTVLVFPEYTVAPAVPRSPHGARALWDALAPAVSTTSNEETETPGALRTYVLPYACVILLCSHKKVDNRCAITAPKLEEAFTYALESRGWEVHTQLDPHIEDDPYSPALETLPRAPPHADNPSADGTYWQDPHIKLLRAAADSQRVLILRCSHIGGHAYAGNAVIYTPNGAGIWYGRVTPHEVEAIVTETIIDGKILSSLFRGGMNVVRPGCKSVLEW